MQLKEKNDIYLLVAKNIKKYRKQQGITQKELSTRTGYSYSYIRRIEGNKCKKTFSLLTIYNIALALNIDIMYLFENKDI